MEMVLGQENVQTQTQAHTSTHTNRVSAEAYLTHTHLASRIPALVMSLVNNRTLLRAPFGRN